MSLRSHRLLVAALLLGGCTPPPEEQKKVITLGAILDLTGDLADIGSEELDAAKLAVEEINAAGGVLGATLALDNRDPALDKDRAKAGAQALVDVGVPAILGSTASGVTLAVAEVTVPAGVVLISGASTSPLLTTVADDGLLFRTTPSDALQGRVLAQRARAKSLTRAATIYVPGAYGEGLSNAFRDAFVAAGGTLTSATAYTEAQQSYTDLLTTVFADNPEAVVLAGYPVDSAQIIKDYLLAFADRNTQWFFSDGLSDTGFVTLVGGSQFTFPHEGTAPARPQGERTSAFNAAFSARYGREPAAGFTGAVNIYDAVYLVALAMEAAGQAQGAAIKTRLADLSAPGGATFSPATFKDALAAVKAGQDINFEGASGSVDMDSAGDVVAPYDIWRVESSQITVVEAGVSPQ
ncbi:MAG: ABC transporter substrate-binding protein [Myxococcota bacterium]